MNKYIIQYKGITRTGANFDVAVKIATELAKTDRTQPAFIFWEHSDKPGYRVWGNGDVEKREVLCTCDFCRFCDAGDPALCSQKPHEWVEWTLYE